MKRFFGKMNDKETVVEALNGWVLVPRGVDKDKFLKMVRINVLVLLLIPLLAFGWALFYSVKTIVSSEGLNVSQLIMVSSSSTILGLIVLIGVFISLPSVPWWGGIFFYNILPVIKVSRKEKKNMTPEEKLELERQREARKAAPRFITTRERSILFSYRDQEKSFEKELLEVLEGARDRELERL